MRLIDADTAIEKFNEAEDYKGYLTRDPEIILNSIPTVDAVPVVHAYWKLTANKNHNICAYCGTFAPLWFDDDGEKIEWLSDYCPNCGAKMDEAINDA